MKSITTRSIAIGAALVVAGAGIGASAASAAAPEKPASAAVKLMKPPAGAKELKAATVKGVLYRRYSITSDKPKDVVAYYASAWKQAGYMVHSGGGGGGWGPWGGSGAGAQAHKGTSYISVNAGARNSGPTYFEVCFGTNKKLVNDCQNLLQNN